MEEKLNKLKRPSLKLGSSMNYFSHNPSTEIKKIKFDEASLAFKEKPKSKVIKDPKTPYVEYEGNDNDYLLKIKEINNLNPPVYIN